MIKALHDKNLSRRPAARTLLAVSLSLTLAAFGCTTDRTLGNGDPVTTPGGRFTPTGGVTSGSESAPSIPPPMISSSYSSVSNQALPRVQSRNMHRLSPDEAALIMAEHAPRVRVLGPAVPGPAGRPYESDLVNSGQFVNPALLTNPQLTINSSVSSPATPAISSGAGEVAGGVDAGGAIISGATVGTANTGLTVGGNATTAATTAGAAVIATPAGTAVTPTAAAIPLPAGTFASAAVSPTAASAVNPGATISASPALAAQRSATMNSVNASAARAAGVATTNPATTSATTTNAAATVTTAGSASATVSPVRLVVDSNGRTVMTNSTSARTSTGTTTTRPQ